MLILCTANQCRSPMAEALLRHHLARHGVSATVSSAGLYPDGAPATGDAVRTMADRGLDLAEHRSRRMGAELVARADVILGMTREHVREVAVLDAHALAKTFTLKELVAAGHRVGPRRVSEPVASWLGRVAMGRRREALLGVGHDDDYDVEDPVGRPRAVYEQTADELDRLLSELVGLLWPDGGANDATGSAGERTA